MCAGVWRVGVLDGWRDGWRMWKEPFVSKALMIWEKTTLPVPERNLNKE